MVPQLRPVIGKPQSPSTPSPPKVAWRLLLQAADLFLEPRDCRETLIPPAFELAGNQSIVGIDRIILPARKVCLIACLFQSEFALPAPLSSGLLAIGNQ